MDTSNEPIDYKQLYEIVTQAVSPLNEAIKSLSEEVKQLKVDAATQPTRQDLENLRTDFRLALKEFEQRSYSREVLDLRFQQISDELKAQVKTIQDKHAETATAVQAIQTAATGRWDRLVSRGSAVIMLVWILIQMIPFLARIFQ